MNPHPPPSRKHAKRCRSFTAEEVALLRAERSRLYGQDPNLRFIPFINRLNGKATGKAPTLSPLPPSTYMLRDDVSRTIEPLPIVDADVSKDNTYSKDANALCVHAPVCGAEDGPSTTQNPTTTDSAETPASSVAVSVPEGQPTELSPDKVADAELVEPSMDDTSSIESEQPTAPCSVAGPPSASTDAPAPVINDPLPHDTVDETTASAQVPILKVSPCLTEPKDPAFDEGNYPSYHEEEAEALIEFDEEMMLDVEIRESGMEQAMQDIKAKFPKTRLPSRMYRQRHSRQEVVNWFCATANIDGIRRHRRSPSSRATRIDFWSRRRSGCRCIRS
ncbi:hypothetical protein BDZ89DRAFT_796729 [Hymenopellis radicata]|nr:hypothetical protein BDZ89DRAFT_796729 [Hymenopellis radicata]